MNISVSIKVKLKPDTLYAADNFRLTTERYRQACNYVSNYVFNHDMLLKQAELNKTLYHDIRDLFGLKAQMAQSVIRTVVARYKTVRTQLHQQPFKYQDINTGKWYCEPRNLSWLRKPIRFSRPQADLQRNRDWSYSAKHNRLSINTLHGRIKVTPICHGFNQYFDGTWQFGVAKLLHNRGKWYLHIAATKKITAFNPSQTQHVVGIDRGLWFLATTYDETGKTNFFNGRAIMRKRAKYQKVRAQLQSKGTKSAKRRLKQLSGRENRWMTDVNHQLSKTLVQHYDANTLFVLEDLTGVTFDTNDLPKSLRNQHRSWAFYQLEQMLTYKAHLNGSEVITVSAQYTSQRCPQCGIIRKDNRNHEHHEYCCVNCGYRSNDDRIGAMNIQELGQRYLTGIKNFKYELITNA